MKALLTFLVLLVVSSAALAQELPKPAAKLKLVDKTFVFLTAAHGGLVLADGFSTRSFLSRGYVEVNPVSRFVFGPRPTWNRMAPLGTLYVGGTAGFALYLRSKHKWYWWVPQVAGIGVHALAVERNRRLR